jgi:Flp pilus assembly protein TadD
VAAARAQLQAGQPGKARDLLRTAIEKDPDNAAALFMSGQLAEQRGALDQALNLIRRSAELEPGRIPVRTYLIRLLLKDGRYEEALSTARQILELDSALAGAHVSAAHALERMHRVDEARDSLVAALALEPQNGNAAVLLAILERREGQLDEARARLEAVLQCSNDDDVLYRALKELSLVLDKQGKHDEAFDGLARAGDIRMRSSVAQQMDQDLRSRLIACYREGFDAACLASDRSSEGLGDTRRLAFLVGFPRSGTTMTGQILAAHPQIVTADEKPMLHVALRRIAQRHNASEFDLPQLLPQLGAGEINELRDVYWNVAEHEMEASLEGKLLLDKLPINIMNLGIINIIFPDARIIVALRDPRDVCLSCFMQRFSLNDLTINFQTWDRIAHFYAQVMDLWLHYRDVMTLSYLEVRYEDTVEDLERQARRMLQFLGLEWDDAVLRFHEQAGRGTIDRRVSTPSYLAITEKIHGRAAGRWRRFASHYEQVDHDLRRFIQAFGYADR